MKQKRRKKMMKLKRRKKDDEAKSKQNITDSQEIKKEKEKVVQISSDAQPITAHPTKERKRLKHRPPSVYPIPENYTVPENPEAFRSKQREPETEETTSRKIPVGAVGIPMLGKGMPMLNASAVKLKKTDSKIKADSQEKSSPTETKKVEESKPTEAKIDSPVTKPKGVAMPGMANFNPSAVKLKGTNSFKK